MKAWLFILVLLPASVGWASPGLPPGDDIATSPVSRNPDLAGYLAMTERQWSNLDWQLSQRARRLSREELPALEQQAEAGDLLTQTLLGVVYREGVDRIAESGTNRTFRANPDNTRSLYWLRRAAEAGFPMAQVELGEMYYTGHGLNQDWEAARHWLEQAARARYPRAKLNLAQVLMMLDVSPDTLLPLAKEILRQWQGVMPPHHYDRHGRLVQKPQKSPFAGKFNIEENNVNY